MTSIDFPADDQGRRSTSAFGKAVVADALRQVDPTGAAAAQREPNWRGGYVAHMRRLVEAGLASPEDWRTIARSGLDSIHSRLVVGDQPLAEWSASSQPPKTAVIKGEAEPLEELVIPYRGQRLKGAELQAQLESWQKAGVLEPGVIDAVLTVAANPEWLRADGRTIVAVGAGSEMGPFTSLLRWGAQVAAVDLPRPDMWDRLAGVAAERAGTMIVPTATGDVKDAGVDVTSAVPELTEWLAGLEGQLVLGNYVYADGAANVRVCAAVDALTTGLLASTTRHCLGVLGDADRCVRSARGRRGLLGGCVCCSVEGVEGADSAAAGGLRQSFAHQAVHPRNRPRSQRLVGQPARPELRVGQAPSALAGHSCAH
ncbi:MAG: hypothetical protein V9E81_17025 [Marmoricola sp.]